LIGIAHVVFNGPLDDWYEKRIPGTSSRWLTAVLGLVLIAGGLAAIYRAISRS
jgi:hypothetical protein